MVNRPPDNGRQPIQKIAYSMMEYAESLVWRWGPTRNALQGNRDLPILSKMINVARRLKTVAAERFRGEMRADAVVWIVDALQRGGVQGYLAGGWGVDALLGRQTRAHDDLDLVLANFEEEEPRACSALETLGFEVVHKQEAGVWMPLQTLLDDGAGHRVELLSVDYQRIAQASSGGSEDHATVGLETDSLFAEGLIDGRRLPCLSVRIQRLFHSGYELRASDERDLDLLRDLA